MAAARGSAKSWGGAVEGKNDEKEVFEVESFKKHSMTRDQVILAYWKKHDVKVWRARRLMRAFMGFNLAWTIQNINAEIDLLKRHLNQFEYEYESGQSSTSSTESAAKRKKTEMAINQKLKELGHASISIKNEFDLVPPPDWEHFTYERIIASDLVTKVKNTNACLCSKAKVCGVSTECCLTRNESKLSYDPNGLLIAPESIRPIYECSTSCQCPVLCLNRVVQRGRQFKLQLTRSIDGFWYICPLVDLEKGTFVGELMGEVISTVEAERRFVNYGQILSAVTMMEMVVSDGQSKYVLDRTKSFDLTRFVHHSCDANLVLHLMYTGEEEEALPHLVLFTKSKVPRLTPLTLCWIAESTDEFDESTSDQLQSKGLDHVRCKCGSDQCRNLLWYRGRNN